MNVRPARRLRRWLATAGLLAGCWLGLNHEPRRSGIVGDSAAIYALLLDELEHAAPIRQPIRFVEVTPAPATYVEMNVSPLPRKFGWLVRDLPGAQPATVASFERRVRDHSSLRHLLPRARTWPVGRGADGNPELPLDWLPLHGFSHIGFNPARTQAIVYVSYVCGGMCGDGHYVLLNRSGRVWRIATSLRAWIS